jgi:hypothetical protein
MAELTPSDVRKVLSSHGHGFQYAVIRRAEELANRGLSSWIFEAAEFPVGGIENTIHIDFVLRAARAAVYIVAECKRADPARANWCFVKAPYTRRNAYENEVVFEEVVYQPGGIVHAGPRAKQASIESCHLGFELRTAVKGDGSTAGGSAIKDATSQVLRAVNGLVDHLFPRSAATDFQREGTAVFVPVIFTTAKLWVAAGDLSAAHLTTGRLPDDWGTLKTVSWLWFSHNQSPALRHQLRSTKPTGFEISKALHAEYTRTIAVVGPEGVDTFLQADLIAWL